MSRDPVSRCVPNVAVGHATREALLEIVHHREGGLRGVPLQIGQLCSSCERELKTKGVPATDLSRVKRLEQVCAATCSVRLVPPTLTTQISEASIALADARTMPA